MRLIHVMQAAGAMMAAAGLCACAAGQVRSDEVKAATEDSAPVAAAEVPRANPLLEDWDTPYGLPPFDRIQESDYLPAVKAAIESARAEIQAITANPDAPTFENTILALDRSGRGLEKVEMVLYNLSSAETTPGIQAILRDAAPLSQALSDDIYLDRKLYARVNDVWTRRNDLGLGQVEVRLIDQMRKAFVRSGAGLDDAAQARLRDVNQELTVLGLKFGDNLLAETNAFKLVLDKTEDLAGLEKATIDAAAAAAAGAGMPGKWLVTLSYPSMWPFVQQSTRRDLREKVIRAYAERCNQGNEFDNKVIVRKIADLRVEKAKLLGYASWADFILGENMAKNPAGVDGLLNRLWKPAKAVARREAAEYLAAARKDGLKGPLEPWDWHYYAEKTRAKRYGLDMNALREYFSLEDVLAGAFELVHRLYGITFTPVSDLKLYNPEVRAWEVRDADGTFLGLFLGDYHPRPGKRVGAWCSQYRRQEMIDGKDLRPIVVNVGNFTRPSGDAPALLSPDEAETLFHELGHAIHGLVGRVPYRFLGDVPRDFVELPSQIMENWVFEPEMLALYARHYKTGEVIPKELVDRIQAASKHNQGFATVEYLAASMLDMEWHRATATGGADTATFERNALKKIGMPSEILPRYRSTYFNHIFGGGGGYSAGYYSYIWSQVLDSDAFEAFKESGKLFNPDIAKSFRKNCLEPGGTLEADAMYRTFRGRDPEVGPLLKKRGLVPAK